MSDDLLNEIDGDTGEILDDISEEDVTPWKPQGPDGVSGIVEVRDQTKSDYPNPDGSPKYVPVVVLRTADGSLRRIVGYHSLLAKEIEAKDPCPGDQFGVKYLGTRPLKSNPDKSVHVYRSAVRRGQSPAAPADTSRVAPF